jgi:hypothetical protein
LGQGHRGGGGIPVTPFPAPRGSIPFS